MEYTLMLLASNTSFRDLLTSLYAFVCRGLRGLRIDKAVVGAGIRQRLAGAGRMLQKRKDRLHGGVAEIRSDVLIRQPH